MKFLKKTIPIALCVLVVAIMPFAYKRTSSKESFPLSTQEHKFVLTLWHVEVFEGGVGSRGDFLSSVAVDFRDSGALVMVVNHTVESAENAVKNGNLPDMISFGVGVNFVKGYAKSLPDISFLGGEHAGKIYAYPWCAGGYFVIRKNQDNQPIDRLFVSQNTYNLPILAIEKGEVKASSYEYKKPLDAYTAYLGGKSCDALLGTQRDLKRLEKRGVEFYASPVKEFSDLVQYVSILTSDKKRFAECLKYCELLIDESTQQKLEKIGMTSAIFSEIGKGSFYDFSFNDVLFTVSPFTDSGAVSQLVEEIRVQNITNNSLLRLKNMLKRL